MVFWNCRERGGGIHGTVAADRYSSVRFRAFPAEGSHAGHAEAAGRSRKLQDSAVRRRPWARTSGGRAVLQLPKAIDYKQEALITLLHVWVLPVF